MMSKDFPSFWKMISIEKKESLNENNRKKLLINTKINTTAKMMEKDRKIIFDEERNFEFWFLLLF